jgi:hypothetical protein
MEWGYKYDEEVTKLIGNLSKRIVKPVISHRILG